MESSQLYNIEKLIEFRKEIHENPETGFQEYKTGEKIIQYLKEIGVDLSSLKRLAKTGITLDIHGKGLKVKFFNNKGLICYTEPKTLNYCFPS